MTTHGEHVVAEELSAGRGDDVAAAQVRKVRTRAFVAVALIAVVVGDVRLIAGRQRVEAQRRALDRVVVTTQLGGLDSSSSSSGQVTVAEAEVLIHNGGRYAVTLEELNVQLPGIAVVGWRVPDRRVGAGKTTSMQVLVRATCATRVGASPAGRLTVAVTSAAGLLHHFTTPLAAIDGLGDPFAAELSQACGSLAQPPLT